MKPNHHSQPPSPPSLTVAFAPALLPSYEANEHNVVERSAKALRSKVEQAGGTFITSDGPIVTGADAQRAANKFKSAAADLVVLQASTFAMGDMVLPMAKVCNRLCLWAPSEPRKDGPIPLNGFVAMHLHAGVLAKSSAVPALRYTWLFGDAGTPLFDARIEALLSGLVGVKAMEHAHIGRIGEVAPSFFNVASDAVELQCRTGATTKHLPLEATIQDAASIANAPPGSETEKALETAVEKATTYAATEGLSDADVRANIAVYLALKNAASTHNLQALAVRDWPEFQEALHLHPGMAFSWLDHHDGIPVAAEADVGGAVSMLMLRAVSGQPAMLLDVNDMDLERDALLTWHCGGSPLAIADPRGVRWTPHTTLGRGNDRPMGAVADLVFRPGPVTLARIGRDGASWFVVEGEAIDSPHSGFDGSRGWIAAFRDGSTPLSVPDVIETLMSNGVEHHLALIPGHYADAVRSTAWWLGAHVIGFERYSTTPSTSRSQAHHPWKVMS